MSTPAIRRLEFELDKYDFDDPRYIELDAEINRLMDEFNDMHDVHKIIAARVQEEAKINGHQKRIADKYGDYNDWFEWATAQYTITPDYKVISNAANWEEEKSWKFNSKSECLEKIEQLVEWKHYDHHVRTDQ